MSDLKAYLAEKYMSGPKADAILAKTKKKKRKKTETEGSTGVSMIVDEDGGLGWTEHRKDEEDDAEMADPIVASDRTFKKRRKDESWITVQPAREATPPPAPDEQPIVVEEAEFTGGLVSASQFKKVLPVPGSQVESQGPTAEEIALAQETVYRDSSGRKIDTKAARAEAARLKRLKEEKEVEKMEWGKGLVQRDEVEQRKKELEKARSTAFARHADDAELNEEQKSKEHWNDPAAAFLTVRCLLSSFAALLTELQKKRQKGPKKPEYTGPAPPPNRFGIKPGYRWDGVGKSLTSHIELPTHH